MRDDGGPVAGWVLVGSGAAALGLGVVSYVLMDGKTSDFEARKQGQTFVGSESEARALEDEAQTWWLVGTIATGVGVAAAATGLVLVLTHDSGPTTRGAVDVTGSLLPDGGLVMVRAGFSIRSPRRVRAIYGSGRAGVETAQAVVGTGPHRSSRPSRAEVVWSAWSSRPTRALSGQVRAFS